MEHSDGLFRVDLFSNIKNELVLNEFESLGADYGSTKVENEFKLCSKLKLYWKKKIQITSENFI